MDSVSLNLDAFGRLIVPLDFSVAMEFVLINVSLQHAPKLVFAQMDNVFKEYANKIIIVYLIRYAEITYVLNQKLLFLPRSMYVLQTLTIMLSHVGILGPHSNSALKYSTLELQILKFAELRQTVKELTL